MTDNSLLNLGDLTKPATVLIEKISDAIGGVFKPYQMIRVANAEREVEFIRAQSQIKVTDLHRRALHRFLNEEAKKQSNIEEITARAARIVREDSAPQNVEDDWITNFFDKCRIVSDADMQRLWSRVLAEEANQPGAFSRRTVNLVADLNKYDAEVFANFCGYTWMISNSAFPLVVDVDREVYGRHGIHFESLVHLESLGLIDFNSLTGFARSKLPKVVEASYFSRAVTLTFPSDSDNKLELGKVLVTRAGRELARVCDCKPVEGFFDYVHEIWETQSLVPKRTTEPDAS